MKKFKAIITWCLTGFGLLMLIYPRITHSPLVPVFKYHQLNSYNPVLIPFVYIFSYLSRAWGALLFAFMLGGIIASFVPHDKMRNLLSGRRVHSYFLAALFAPLLTVCSCAMIPIFGGILIAGAGIGPAISFLLMCPAANFLAIIMTGELISWKIAGFRFIFSFIGAVLIGWVIDKTPWGRRESERYGKISEKKAEVLIKYDFWEKSENALDEAWGLVKRALPYLLLGVAIVSYIEAYLPKEIVTRYFTGLHGIVIAASIGVPLYTPTLVEVFFVRAMMNLGMSGGAALAFLIGAPMASIPSMLGVSRIINWRCVLNYAILAIICGIIAGIFYEVL